MRFITEFELNAHKDAVDAYKSNGVWNLGLQIRDALGWKEVGFINEKGLGDIRHTLEIEAFPMDKWIEFEKRFYDALPDYDVVSKTRLINALTALMTFQGKPSGDIITKPK